VLIEAAKELPDNCVIHIAGTGPLYATLKEKIEKKDLSQKVFLLGRITDDKLEEELKNCFLFCLPSISRAEMFGVVQVEAFCHGKPVISTNIPRSGVSEVNLDGVTGYSVAINNSHAIADKIKYLLSEKEVYQRFCINALARGRELTSPHIIDQYIKLFRSLYNE
jgi:glycosyltransferase involved in cell wall biosynthesis